MVYIYSVAVVSLGCSKNTVDTEIMLHQLEKEYKIIADHASADILIVNTCGFIRDAKEESISTIFELAAHKANNCKILIVTGCLAQRYSKDLLKDIPEIDIVMGVEQYLNILPAIKSAQNGERFAMVDRLDIALSGKRRLITPKYSAYVKIAEGCNNSCSFCAIPMIRGKYRSVAFEVLIKEMEDLVSDGVSEIILIAEDTTRYGIDLYGKPRIAELVDTVAQIKGLKFLRLLYCYPDSLSYELIDTMTKHENVCKYLDIPLQHADETLLKSMNRRGTPKEFTQLIAYARQKGFTIRTTFIVGFPGETEEQFNTLLNYVETMEFDRMGAFAYSAEEGTRGAKMPNQISESLKNQRLSEIMAVQADISAKKNKERIGQELEILVEGLKEDGYIHGRSAIEAPEVDGVILMPNKKGIKIGTYHRVKIISSSNYDLYGAWIGENDEYTK